MLAWRKLKVIFPSGVDNSISRGLSTTHFYFHRAYDSFVFCGEIMIQRPATAGPAAAAAAVAVHRACYNQLATTLKRYHAQRQQATPCACDRSALYCVELLWKALEIRQPSHLLVPGIFRLLLLFGFVWHKTQIQQQTTVAVERARYNQHPCRAQQQQAIPCACGRYTLYPVELLCRT